MTRTGRFLEIRKIEQLAAIGDAWADTITILIYTIDLYEHASWRDQLTRFNVDIDRWIITGGIKTSSVQ